MIVKQVDERQVVQLVLENGWTVSLAVNPLRPVYGVSCIALREPRQQEIALWGKAMKPVASQGPQEATDDEVAEWIAEVAGRKPE